MYSRKVALNVVVKISDANERSAERNL